MRVINVTSLISQISHPFIDRCLSDLTISYDESTKIQEIPKTAKTILWTELALVDDSQVELEDPRSNQSQGVSTEIRGLFLRPRGLVEAGNSPKGRSI